MLHLVDGPMLSIGVAYVFRYMLYMTDSRPHIEQHYDSYVLIDASELCSCKLICMAMWLERELPALTQE